MTDLRIINDRIAVAPQIAPDDIAAIKAAGYVAIVNNRPDDEEPGQPTGAEIAAAAEAAGSAYACLDMAVPASAIRSSTRWSTRSPPPMARCWPIAVRVRGRAIYGHSRRRKPGGTLR